MHGMQRHAKCAAGGCVTCLVDLDDLTVCLFDLLECGEVVPEAGARDDTVGREDLHAVHGRLGVLLRGLAAPDNQILVHLQGAAAAGKKRQPNSRMSKEDRRRGGQVAADARMHGGSANKLQHHWSHRAALHSPLRIRPRCIRIRTAG